MSAFMDYSIPKLSLEKKNLTHYWGIGELIPFPKVFPKMNMIAQLEFELTYFETAVQHFSISL